MPPKAAPAKDVSTKNPPPRGAQSKGAPARGGKGTGKKAKEKRKDRKLNLKGWLETKADWAKFDAWAQINAQPRKIPEPEPVVRPSKPLSKLKKRIVILSKPPKRPDTSKTCRSDMRVSRKALIAKPSKRIIQLATFVVKHMQPCPELPAKIRRSALRYRPTKRIIEISQPNLRFSEYCKFLATRQSEETTEREKRLALAKKAIECPDLMTDEEINILMTPMGIYRSALSYKFTEWMAYLALPSYRFLKDQTDEKAEEWKKFILEESETRGKKALEYKKKKKAKTKKSEEDVKNLEEKEGVAKNDDEEQPIDVESEKEGTAPEEKPEEDGEPNETNEPPDEAGDTIEDPAPKVKEDNKEFSNVEPKSEDDSRKQKEMTPEEEEAAEQRKAERNAWRFVPSPCKENPFEIKKSALEAKASPRTEELAKPNVHKDRSCRANPFAVRKSALDGPVPGRIPDLAKPSHPRDPVERPPPRDKDDFGRVIFPKPPYGKKMPRVKRYEEAECPDKDSNTKDEEEKKKKEETKRRAIDPIAYEASIDPYIDPERAARQLKARKAVKEEMERRKKQNEIDEKKSELQEIDTTE